MTACLQLACEASSPGAALLLTRPDRLAGGVLIDVSIRLVSCNFMGNRC